MKGTGARNVCPGSCVSTGATFPVASVESAPMGTSVPIAYNWHSAGSLGWPFPVLKYKYRIVWLSSNTDHARYAVPLTTGHVHDNL